MAAISSTTRSSYRPSISLVLPAYNEEAVIEQAVTEAVEALARIADDFEVLVVDDGSSDGTAMIVEQAARRSPHVRLLRQHKNRGYGAALRRGFGEATKELVGFTDADCQFKLNELDRLVFLARDYQIVCGYRIDRKDSWLRRTYSAGYNLMVRNLLGTRVRDCDCALKLFHRDVLAKLPITTDGFLVNGEMLASARQQEFSLVEVGVSHRPRAAGYSKVSITHIPVVLAALVRFWWNRVMFSGTNTTVSTGNPWSVGKVSAMSAVLLGIGSLLFFINLKYALIEPDEARYAQISLEMVETGNWLVPRLDGKPYLDKPPLLYWSTAISYSLFGVNELTARLPCALAGLGTVLAVYLLGRSLVGDRAAWYGGLLLMACGGFIAAGRFIMMDGLLTLFTTITLLAAYRAMFSSSGSLKWLLVAGCACGCGILTKGPVAPVLCLPPVLMTAWLTRDYRLFGPRNLLAFCVPTIAIAAPWFVQVAAEQSEFVGYFFWKHNFVRYVNAFDHQQPWWFYVPMLALGVMPTTLLLPGLVAYLGARRERESRLRTPELGALLLSAAWIVAFFSLSSCKLVTYILPAFPLLALAMGKMFHDAKWSAGLSISYLQRLTGRAAWFTVSTISWVAIGAAIVQVSFNANTWVLAAVFTVIPVTALTLLYGKWLHSYRQLVVAAVATYVIAATYGFGYVVPEFAEWRSISRSAAKVQAEIGGTAPVVFFGRQSQAASFAIAGDVVEFSSDQAQAFEAFMENHAVAVVVANHADYTELCEECSDTLTLQGPRARSRVYVATRHAAVARNLESPTTLRR